VLPLRDDNPTRRLAYVTMAIIAVNVAVFVLWEPTFASGAGAGVVKERFFFCHALIPFEFIHRANLVHAGPAAGRFAEQVVEGLGLARACPDKSWWQSVFTSMFMHVSWLHIGGNMLFLWVFGTNVEDKLGPVGYLLFYLASGVVATLAQVAVIHTGENAIIPNLGASGAIAGVLGAYLLMFPRRRVLTLVIFFFITAVYLPAFVVLGAWFILQAFSGVAALSQRVNAGGGVAVWAHIGGFAFGSTMALLFFPKERFGLRPPPPRPDIWRGRRWGRRRQPPPWDGGYA
jgi:membrane associated rhomboid family serine protease